MAFQTLVPIMITACCLIGQFVTSDHDWPCQVKEFFTQACIPTFMHSLLKAVFTPNLAMRHLPTGQTISLPVKSSLW